MATEAAASGKPVYVMMFGAAASDRVESFQQDIREAGHVREFQGDIDFTWRPAPMLETPRIAGEIAERFLASRG